MKIVMPSRLIIAEAGSVHDGSFGNACAMIDMAAAAGANIVKFQTHIADAETIPGAPLPAFFKGEPRFEYFERTGFNLSQWRELKARCDERGVVFLSSPFSEVAVDLLEEVGAALYKVPSGEVTNVFLLERLAATGKPVILSSGMSNWAELDRAVEILRATPGLTVLQCSSAYPCTPEQVGLNVMGEMQRRYNTHVGLSDHTLDCAAAFAAASLGATVIEKHVTFSKQMYGSDARHSMEPAQFKTFCDGLKAIWRMLDHPVDKDDVGSFKEMKHVFEKSLVAARPMRKGHVITRADLAAKKAGGGIPVVEFTQVVGRRLRQDVPQNFKLSADVLDPSSGAG
jgi:N-acetylneuraminate synthase